MIGLAQKLASIAGYGDKNQISSVPASLFLREDEFGISELPFDLLIDERHRLDFEVTEHPIENGSSVADHVREKLRRLEISGMFSNHSLRKGRDFFAKENGKIPTEADAVVIDGLSAVTNTALERFESLKEIARKRLPIKIITALEVYDNLVIESISAGKQASDGEAIKFSLVLREIQTAEVRVYYTKGFWYPPEQEVKKTDSPKKQKLASKSKKSKKKGQKSAIQADAEHIVSNLRRQVFE